MLRQSWGLGFGVVALVQLGCNDGSSMSPELDPGIAVGGTTSGEGFPTAGSLNVAFQPELPGAVFTAAQPPPPVSGGTLLVLRDQKTAIVADPDRDQVLVVDLTNMAVTRTLTLDAHAEPGRADDDAAGHVHLVLRGSGKLMTFDPTTGDVLGTRSVCAYPRGVAVSDTEQLAHVACAEGKLVSLSTTATESAPTRTLTLDRDLRDVVVASDGLWVSRFRSAEVLRLDAAGALVSRTKLPSAKGFAGESVASVAWRMVAGANGGVVVVHQRAFTGEVIPSPGGYGSSGAAGGIVAPAVSTVSETGVTMGTSVAFSAPLPVDVAQSPTTGQLLVASAGVEHPVKPSFMRLLLLSPTAAAFSTAPTGDDTPFTNEEVIENASEVPQGQLVAVAFVGETPLMQFREPSQLVFGKRGISLPGNSVSDTGNLLFNLQTSSGLACASCHPEGQEDGHVWNFAGFGARRTQSLRGGLLGTEPFHWDGAEGDFTALTTDVMQGRMGGPALTPEQTTALAGYIDKFPALPAPAAAASSSAERGKALFNDANVGCATCHSGTRFTNNQTMDVGNATGNLQVPGLVGLWARAPYLHDGCAGTLADRFTRCDTGKHGNLVGLTEADVAALSDYLETL